MEYCWLSLICLLLLPALTLFLSRQLPRTSSLVHLIQLPQQRIQQLLLLPFPNPSVLMPHQKRIQNEQPNS